MFKNKKILIVLVLILTILAFFPIDFNKNNKVLINKESGILKISEKEKINKEIVQPIKKLEFIYESKEEISVYQFMQELKKTSQIDFKEKDYPSLGKFITEVNGVKNGEKNWIYYVNNQKANLGISNYKINSGDIISWRYESR